jgi:hypothetical protein
VRVLQKWSIVAAVLAAPLAAGATALATPQFAHTFTAKYTPKKTSTSAGISIAYANRDPGAPGGIPEKAMTKIVVELPPGTRIATGGVYGQCKATTIQATTTGAAACPVNSRIGTGRASFASDPAGPRLSARVTAFNKKNGILLLLEPAGLARVALDGRLAGARLTISIPQTLQFGRKVVMTDLQFAARRKSVGRGGKRKHYLTTPRSCTGSWTTRSTVTFDDASRATRVSKQTC